MILRSWFLCHLGCDQTINPISYFFYWRVFEIRALMSVICNDFYNKHGTFLKLERLNVKGTR